MQSRAQTLRTLLLGGLLPVLAFTLVEEYFGVVWGLVTGLLFGVGEIISEYLSKGRVDGITWFGNGALIVLGSISLFTQEGIWFKLQPAILEAAFGIALIGSVIIRKPLLVAMAMRQNVFAKVPMGTEPLFRDAFRVFTLRLGVFFIFHSILATYAAYSWSTKAWALLKGVGFTGSMILYLLFEALYVRWMVGRKLKREFFQVRPQAHSEERAEPPP